MTKAPPYYAPHSKVELRLSLRYYKKNPLYNQHMVTKGYHFYCAGRLQSTCTSIASHMRVKANFKLSKDSNGFTVNRS